MAFKQVMQDVVQHQTSRAADVGVWAIVTVGWLGWIQPWLTAIATILAIAWSATQLYAWWKYKK